MAKLSWYAEAEAASWSNPNELKSQYWNASVLTDKRVAFNIHGNTYRLIVDIEYRLIRKVVFMSPKAKAQCHLVKGFDRMA